MNYYLLTETAAGSGRFVLTSHAADASGTAAAVAALSPLNPDNSLRIAVWPYRRMSGDPALVPVPDAEAGHEYQVLTQADGTSEPFTLTDEVVTSDAHDAALPLIVRQNDAGYRLALMPHAAPASSGSTGSSGSGGSTEAAAAEPEHEEAEPAHA